MIFHGPILRYEGMKPLYNAAGLSVFNVCNVMYHETQLLYMKHTLTHNKQSSEFL